MSLVKYGVVVVYLVAMGAIGYDLYANVATKIEAGIENNVQQALPNGSRHGAEVTVSGRDIRVSGLLHDTQEKDALSAALQDLDGHRIVRMEGVKLLPVATSYRAELKIQDKTVSLQTVLPDDLSAAQMRGGARRRRCDGLFAGLRYA